MITWKQLVKAQTLTASAVSYYTAPANTYASIQAATVYNPTAAAVSVKVYVVPSGGSAADATTFCVKSVPATSTSTLAELINHKLEPGAQIYALGLACTLNISGAENVPE